MLSYSVIIPTNRKYWDLTWLLKSLNDQKVLPEFVVILYDRKVTKKEHQNLEKKCKSHSKLKEKIILVSQISDPKFMVKKGVSWLRNYGFWLIKTPLVLSVDDDNEFSSDFCEKLIESYQNLFGENWQGIVQPVEELRNSWTVRFAGYKRFSPFRVRPTKIKYNPEQKKPYKSFLAPSNCFLGSVELFKNYPFDNKLKFAYEDFLFFARLYKAWYPIYMCPKIRTHHMMSPRNMLQNLYIETPERAFQKTRNKSILMKEIGTKRDLFIYYTLGFWLQSGWQWLHVVIFAPRKQKLPLCRAIIRGTLAWVIYRRGRNLANHNWENIGTHL